MLSVKTYDDPAPLSEGELSEIPKNEARRSYIDNGPKMLGLANKLGLVIGLSPFAGLEESVGHQTFSISIVIVCILTIC